MEISGLIFPYFHISMGCKRAVNKEISGLIFQYFHRVEKDLKYGNIRRDISIFPYFQGPCKYRNMEISDLIFLYFQPI